MRFKIGDKVRVKSLEWYNENKSKEGHIGCDDNVFFAPFMSKFCGSILTIKNVDVDIDAYNVEENSYYWTDNMLEGLAEDTIQPVVFENIVFPNENYTDKVELCLGDDYEIVVEDGKTFVQKKKPKYPTTYEECCGVLKIAYVYTNIIGVTDKEYILYFKFIKLIRCRNAYWKIAGEQMELGKSWEPNYVSLVNNEYFTIHTFNNEIIKSGTSHRNAILAFPTAEMRDAFYENFKNLIEGCKELL